MPHCHRRRSASYHPNSCHKSHSSSGTDFHFNHDGHRHAHNDHHSQHQCLSSSHHRRKPCHYSGDFDEDVDDYDHYRISLQPPMDRLNSSFTEGIGRYSARKSRPRDASLGYSKFDTSHVNHLSSQSISSKVKNETPINFNYTPVITAFGNQEDCLGFDDYYKRRVGYGHNGVEHQQPKTFSTTYMVAVATGDMPTSGTYANAFIRLNGSRGKLEKTWLKTLIKEGQKVESPRQHNFHFSPGSVANFKIDSPDLGELRSVTLGHDGLDKKDSWFVKFVEVSNVQNRLTWHFTCDDWLSAQRGDRKVVRELSLEQPDCTDYEILVTTGNRYNCETTANVYITLFGGNGRTEPMALKNWKKWCFRRGQTDKFILSGRNVGKISKIRVEHDNSGFQPKWFVERIVITNLDKPSERFNFNCGVWFSLEDEARVTHHEFVPSLNPLDDQKLCQHKLVVTTGKQACADTNADIWLQLFGDQGASDPMQLKKANFSGFKRGSEETFFVKMLCCGVLNKLRIQNCNNSLQPAWYLEKILIQDIDDKTMFLFPANRWIGGEGPRAHLWVELMPGRMRFEPEPVADYIEPSNDFHFRVHTSNIKNAGTDAKVYGQLYGDSGKSTILEFGGAGRRFSMGSVDEIRLPLECIGQPYKMRVWHDNNGNAPAWHLKKIELTTNGKHYLFPCERWISDKEDDMQAVRELPATGNGISKALQVLKYYVTVVTGSHTNAETDANVFICLNGERGDTGDRYLTASLTQRDTFTQGKRDEFIIEAVDLKKIRSVRIGHDNSGRGPAWFLEKVIVRDFSGQREQVFPCNRWLAVNEDDGEIVRELFEQKEPPKPTGSIIRVHTSNIQHAGTDAHVFIQLYGDQGKSEIIALEGKGDHFEAGQVDEIFHEPGTIGTPYKMRIWHDNKGRSPAWHLDKVEWMKDGLNYVFPCGRWLSFGKDDNEIVRELPATGSTICHPLPVIKYKVSVTTGNMANATTDANVFCCLNGERGDTGDRELRINMSKSTRKFERGKTDDFIIEAVDLMKIRSVRIGHDNSGRAPGWFVEKVVVRELSEQNEQVFLCNRWLAADEDDGEIVRELFEHKKHAKATSQLFRIYTSNIRNAGTDAHVFIQMYGDQGKSGIIAMEGKGDKFETGQIDEIQKDPGPIGTPYKMRIWHDNKGHTPAWHLDKVEWLKDKLSYYFPCGRWLAADKDDNETVRELPATGSGVRYPLQVLKYKISITTGNMKDAGTDANVFCCLNGERGDTGDRELRINLSKSTNKFDKGKTDDFIIEAVDLMKIKSVRIGHDNSGRAPGWFVDKVVVRELSGQNEQVFPCNRWLAVDEDDGQIARELFETFRFKSPSQTPRYSRFSVHTSNIRNAGTDANVFVQLYGDRGKSKAITFKGAGEKFESGSVEEIFISPENVGKPYKMRIWHNNKGSFPGWHLDKVEWALNDHSCYVFVCNRWLATDEEDGQIVRELPASGNDITRPLPVSVVTGSKFGSGTDANVFCCLNGERGDTGDRPLKKSSKHMNKFEAGNTDEFIIEAVDLMKIKSVRIGHDNAGGSSGWFLDKVMVRETTGKYGGEQVFPCNRWLATNEDDGQISRELFEGSSVNKNIEKPKNAMPCKVTVKTGDKFGAGTDSNVFIVLCCEKGETSRLPLKDSENNAANKFERNSTDIFCFDLKEDLGHLKSVKLSQDGKMMVSDWYVAEVLVEFPKYGVEYICPANRWVNVSHGEVLLQATPKSKVAKETQPIPSRLLSLRK